MAQDEHASATKAARARWLLWAALTVWCTTPGLASSEEWTKVERVPADAQSVSASAPIFSQVVVLRIPVGWKLAHEQTTQTAYILELIPEQQTLQSWTDMITVQGFRDLAQNPKVTPRAMLAGMAGRVKQACAEQFVAHSLGDRKIDSFDAHTAIIGCASLPAASFGAKVGQSEIAYYLAVKGRHDLYLIHRAARGDAFDRSHSPMSPANAEDILRALQPIKICERSEPPSGCWNRVPR